MTQRDRETVVVTRSGGGIATALLFLVAMIILGYLLFGVVFRGDAPADLDVDVDAPTVDVVPDGQ